MKDKNKGKQSIFGILFLVIFLVGGTFIGVVFVEPSNRKNEQYRIKQYSDNFNETYRGIIIDKITPKDQPKPGLKQSLVTLKLDYSTIKHFDPRDSLIYFDCIIDYPYAEVIIRLSGRPNIGDSLIYDGIKDLFYVKIPSSSWYHFEPNVTNLNNKYVKQFITIPKYNKKQLEEREKTYPKPLELPNDYYMLLFGKFREEQKLLDSYKNLSELKKYKNDSIPKYSEKRGDFYYFFINDKRYGSYHEAFIAWKESGFIELYIAKFDKHNKFKQIIKKKEIE